MNAIPLKKEWCPNFVGAYLRGRPFAARSGRSHRGTPLQFRQVRTLFKKGVSADVSVKLPHLNI